MFMYYIPYLTTYRSRYTTGHWSHDNYRHKRHLSDIAFISVFVSLVYVYEASLITKCRREIAVICLLLKYFMCLIFMGEGHP